MGDSADVRNIISDDDLLQDGILPALGAYNVVQFTTVDVPGHAHQVVWYGIRYCYPLTEHITVDHQ